MHGATWRPLKYCLEMHGATVYILNIARATWRPFRYSLDMHGAAWSHSIYFKYYRSRMETFKILFKDALSHMEPQCRLLILQELHGNPLNIV